MATSSAGCWRRGCCCPTSQSPFSVYVTHLDHLSEAVRVQQLAALLQWTIRDRERPHLLSGRLQRAGSQRFSG
jgi:endonuclease/exonuclease/phosphatase family metal-dependent hydrolase